jgi:hypothetical protein
VKILRFTVVRDVAKMIWAFPCTTLGLSVGCWGLLTGGRVRRQGAVFEFHGGAIPRLLRSIPIPGGAAAMTLGHVVLGREICDLDRCRAHELVHVRQYERWGVFFIPAYLGSSCYLWLTGQDPYRDNPFERQAFTPPPDDPSQGQGSQPGQP